MLDFNKPLMTGNYRVSRVLATDIKGEYPIIVACLDNEREFLRTFTKEGWPYITGSSRDDLRNAPPPPITKYINVYLEPKGYTPGDLHDTPDRARARGSHAVAVAVPVTFTPQE